MSESQLNMEQKKHSVSIAVNIPYMLYSIGNDYSKLNNIHHRCVTRSVEDTIVTDTEVALMDECIASIKRKSDIIKGYLDKYNLSIYDYRKTQYRDFYLYELEDFINAWDDQIERYRKEISNEGGGETTIS